MFQFLIDECLSPQLAAFARSEGFHALHVNWAKLDGTSDQLVAVYAIARDMVFVTNNGSDFKPIYKALDLHPGLVVVLRSAKKAGQLRMFEAVVERLRAEPDTVNKLIEVDENGVVSICDFPSPGTIRRHA